MYSPRRTEVHAVRGDSLARDPMRRFVIPRQPGESWEGRWTHTHVRRSRCVGVLRWRGGGSRNRPVCVALRTYSSVRELPVPRVRAARYLRACGRGSTFSIACYADLSYSGLRDWTGRSNARYADLDIPLITTKLPSDWRALQREVAAILTECGFAVEVEKKVQTVRGSVELDVYAEETVDGRRYVIACECKHWASAVPQTVVHSFRTVVADLGAHLGLIVCSGGFQSGAVAAAQNSNIRLVDWEGFQREFEVTWFTRHFSPVLTSRCDPLLTYCEPLLPRWFSDLSEEKKHAFIELKRQHDSFGWLVMMFTTYMRSLSGHRMPVLPVRSRLAEIGEDVTLPDSVADAVGYREFLEAVLAHSDEVVAQFRMLRPATEAPSPHE